MPIFAADAFRFLSMPPPLTRPLSLSFLFAVIAAAAAAVSFAAQHETRAARAASSESAAG